MVERKRIGLSYTYNENWIGGTYYIENLINALNTLPDQEKPHIVLITSNQRDLKTAKKKMDYPYLSFQLGSGESNRIFQFINKVTGRLFKIRFFNQEIKKLDAVFPYYECIQQSAAKKRIYWIPDFQEHFAPGFFSREAIEARVKDHSKIQISSDYLIISSNNAATHFRSLYPSYRVSVNVLPFAVTHPGYKKLEITALLQKFRLPPLYFICPNQFWAHKNQLIVLKAIKILKERGVRIIAAFTGKTDDYRNPAYFKELLDYVEENDLKDHVFFLGFIDRAEQLQLMHNAIAIVQPSLFEGWSTVVEDAKAMNKFIIVSDIDIHHEQLESSRALFFNPDDERDLAAALKQAANSKVIPTLYEDFDYLKNIQDFGRNFMAIAGRAGNPRDKNQI